MAFELTLQKLKSRCELSTQSLMRSWLDGKTKPAHNAWLPSCTCDPSAHHRYEASSKSLPDATRLHDPVIVCFHGSASADSERENG